MTFSQRLRQLREEKRITQAALGRAVDISPRMVSFYESGNHFPRNEMILKRIADYFQVSLDYLLGYSDLREEASLKKLCTVFRELSDSERASLLEYLEFLTFRAERSASRKAF